MNLFLSYEKNISAIYCSRESSWILILDKSVYTFQNFYKKSEKMVLLLTIEVFFIPLRLQNYLFLWDSAITSWDHFFGDLWISIKNSKRKKMYLKVKKKKTKLFLFENTFFNLMCEEYLCYLLHMRECMDLRTKRYKRMFILKLF